MSDIDEDVVAASDEEDELPTASEVLQRLEEAWTTESMSPTLVRYQGDTVDCMLDQINQMTENLKICKKQDFRIAIHKMEIDRIRYILSSYLRVRLEKLERFVHHYIEKDAAVKHESEKVLSPEELEYAKEYAAAMETHFEKTALQHMPDTCNTFNATEVSAKPNLDSFIFFKMKETINGVVVDADLGDEREDDIDLVEGSQYIMRFKTVKDLLQSGSAVFI